MSDITSLDHINQIFNYLDEFRKLPAYQLERRADIFFALYLKEILQENLNVKIDTFIPEFPLKVDRNTEAGKSINLSNKVDYLAISRGSKKIFLVELKTEKSSLRTIQNDYLIKAQANGLHNLLLNLKAIYDASRQKNKYKAILPLIQDLQWLDQELKPILDEHYDIEIVYIIPSLDSLLSRYKTGATIITFAEIIKSLNHHTDYLTQRFLKSLQNWIP